MDGPTAIIGLSQNGNAVGRPCELKGRDT